MKKTYFLALAIVIFGGCTSTKKLKDFSDNNIIFGSGGGIAGITNEYVLHYNGKIEKINSITKDVSQIENVSRQQSKKIFQQFLDNGLDTLEYSVPGNMSYFVGFRNDSLTKKITWGGEGETPPKAKETYYNLIQLINNK